tara:strand:+ start:41 stop:772 length:732 start_codon:yes stop_codon:yes gene_type:complete
MKKFKYKEWVTNHKYGLLNEQTQASGYTGSGVTCYYCDNGVLQPIQQITPPSGNFTAPADPSYLTQNGYCGWTYPISTNGLGPGPMIGAYTQEFTASYGHLNSCTGSGTCPPPVGGCPAGETWNSTACACQTSGTTTASICQSGSNDPCAQQWFGNNAGNFSMWMGNKNDCTKLSNVSSQLGQQIMTLWNNRPNQNVTWGSTSNFNDIKNIANDAGFTQPQKGQFKRKLAKRSWAHCVSSSCC